MNILISIIFLLLGVLFTIFLTRPKLSIAGSGSGGGDGPGYYRNGVNISNQPGLIGFRLKPSIVLGRRVNNYIEKGLRFDRAPARDCKAHLRIKKTGEYISPLWWRSSNGEVVQNVTIGSGENLELIMFARTNSEKSKYFLYEPISSSNTAPKEPPNEAKFDEANDFLIEVTSYGRKKLKFEVNIQKKYDGTLSYSIDGGGGGSF